MKNCSEIAKILLETSNPVHDGGNIELQNWTNDLTDDELNALWSYAEKNELSRYIEKYVDGTSTLFIAKDELAYLKEDHS